MSGPKSVPLEIVYIIMNLLLGINHAHLNSLTSTCYQNKLGRAILLRVGSYFVVVDLKMSDIILIVYLAECVYCYISPKPWDILGFYWDVVKRKGR